jgi:hypothetical protein
MSAEIKRACALALAFDVASASCGQAHAQSAINMNWATGVPLNKALRSLRDIRYNSIVAQQFDYGCGPAAGRQQQPTGRQSIADASADSIDECHPVAADRGSAGTAKHDFTTQIANSGLESIRGGCFQ